MGCAFKAVHYVAKFAVPAHQVFRAVWRLCPAPFDAGSRVPCKDRCIGSAAQADVQLTPNQQKIGAFTYRISMLLEVNAVAAAKLQEDRLISAPMAARAKDVNRFVYHLAHVTYVCPTRGGGLFFHVNRHPVGFKRVAERFPLPQGYVRLRDLDPGTRFVLDVIKV